MKQRINNLLQQGKFKDAEKACKDALDACQTDSDIWSLMATIQAQLGNISEAGRCSVRAIEIAPDDFSAHFCLAMTQQTQGDMEYAISSYRKTVELQP